MTSDSFQQIMSTLQFITLVIAIAGFFITRRKERDEHIKRLAEEQSERARLREAISDIRVMVQSHETQLATIKLVVELIANQHKSNHNQDIGGVL